MVLSGGDQPGDITQGRHRQQKHFEQKTLAGADRQRLAEKTVGGEGKGQRQRYPGQLASLDRQHGDRDRRKHHGRDLQPVEPLAEQQGADHDADQRIDVVAKGGLDGAVDGDRPDVDPPIDRDQRRRERRHGYGAGRTDCRLEIRGAAGPDQNRGGDRHRPDDAVGNHLGKRQVRNRFHVERQQTPQEIGTQRQQEAAAGF